MADVRIFQPAKTAMQSGRGSIRKWVLEFEPGSRKETDNLMGWVGSRDTRGQVRMRFDSKDDAIAFAKRNELSYQVSEPHKRRVKPKAYSDNFAFGKKTLWTH
ncbi:MAG: ETC complex I subunit [Chloroflexi bacterium]|nr:ETC complex I subunit [Chloroflexota bacterium]